MNQEMGGQDKTLHKLSLRWIYLAWFMSAVIFSSAHIALGHGMMVYIFLIGFIAAYLYLTFKNIYPCKLTHFLNKLFAYVFVPLLFM